MHVKEGVWGGGEEGEREKRSDEGYRSMFSTMPRLPVQRTH